jgi:hypothetical protein
VVKKVAKVEMIFLQQWRRVGVGRSGESELRRSCGFNASILARDGGRWDKVLPEDEAETTSSSCLNGKEA